MLDQTLGSGEGVVEGKPLQGKEMQRVSKSRHIAESASPRAGTLQRASASPRRRGTMANAASRAALEHHISLKDI